LSTNTALASLQLEQHLLPCNQSARTRALLFCSRIVHIRIRDTVRIDGNTYYAIELFYQRSNGNIPTTRRVLPLDSIEAATSNAVTYQRFSTFVNLRHEMSFHANVGHNNRPCAFCSATVSFLNDSPALPRLSLKLFHGQDAVTKRLERFLNSVLSLTKKTQLTVSERTICEGQREIPLLLERFLQQTGDDRKPNPTLPQVRQSCK
jgi:hypothetical protein